MGKVSKLRMGWVRGWHKGESTATYVVIHPITVDKVAPQGKVAQNSRYEMQINIYIPKHT
jgi:hypothetical protein